MDWASIAASLSTEISTAIPAFTAVIALVLGVPLAYKVVRRLLR